ncbi:hypothetical protein LMH66_14400 [Shewanella sp. 10N.7]|uniref:hypothetical protein n=1 Tax=Shewanella sp. 10N.7 TaxID=2885093 RepID=UPI001E485CE7|nr:hypothetical protein [Shewanella sp. 10N.7]MCC4833831.1 hypothetical protein [Shewanella sp. 10N.7]
MSESSENKSNRLNLFLAYLGVLTPAGYLIGLSYYQGKLSAFGISSETFPLSVQDTYVSAYYAIGYSLLAIGSVVGEFIELIFSWPSIIYTISVVFGFIGLCYYSIKKKKKTPLKSMNYFMEKCKGLISYFHWKNNDFTKAVGIAGLASYGVLSILYALLFLAIFWFAIPAVAYYKGSENAVKIRDDYLENGCHVDDKAFWGNCQKLQTKNREHILEGILIVHSKEHVAFFNKEGSFVLKIPQGARVIKELPNRNITRKSR